MLNDKYNKEEKAKYIFALLQRTSQQAAPLSSMSGKNMFRE